MEKVLLLENIDTKAVDFFTSQGYDVKTYPQALSGEELRTEIKKATLLGIRSKTKVTAEVIGWAQNLKAIGAFCIGTDQIDLKACRENKIAVFNAPFSNTRSVAELALGEIIMLMRGVMDKSLKMHTGIWQKSAKGSFEIRGKTLGIIGYGNIGSQLGILAELLGMRVLFYDIQDKLPLGNAQKCKKLIDLLSNSDVISVHVDGRKDNNHLIGESEFMFMKEGVFFLNVSRGKIVDVDALARNLRSGKIAGAAVDVFPQEPPKNGVGFITPLQSIPNVILTPHIAGSTEEAQEDIAKFVSQKLHDFLTIGNTDLAVVKPESYTISGKLADGLPLHEGGIALS